MYLIECGWRCKDKNCGRRGERMTRKEEDVVTGRGRERERIDLIHCIYKQREKDNRVKYVWVPINIS